MIKNLVSIIIPTFNEVKNIERCITSVSKQSYKSCEVVLVDDASSDQTVSKANNISRKLQVKLRIKSFNVHQERGVVRNVGAKLAKGEYLFFIDADMELSSEVLKECVNQMKVSRDVKAIIVREESKGTGYWAQCRILEKKCYFGDDDIEAARFFDTQIFWKVGGWDQKMISGEDWDLTRRVREKFSVGRVNTPIYHNEGRVNPYISSKKKYYYMLNSKPYLTKNPLKLSRLLKFGIRPAYIRNWRLFLGDPIHGFGLLILKSMEFTAGFIGLLSLRINRKLT